MNAEQWVTIIATTVLGGSLIGVIVNWRLNKHRPSVDRQDIVNKTGLTNAQIENTNLETLQGVVATLNEHVTSLTSRVEEAEHRAEQERQRRQEAERRLEEAAEEFRSERRELQNRLEQVTGMLREEIAHNNELLANWPVDGPPPPRRKPREAMRE